MNKVKKYVKSTKRYIADRSELFVGIGVVGGLFAVIGIIALAVHLSGPRIVYQPVGACDLLTPAKAQDLLGDKVINTNTNKPTIEENIATSKCGYTDENPLVDQMKIAAIAVRSAINDEGDAQNKTDFAKAKSQAGMEPVNGIGESAFFNVSSGHLNVLSGHVWLIANYGLASSASENTLEKATELAKKVLPAAL